MEETFSAQGFHVLGFYSDDFGNQGGDPGACTDQYMVTYPQFDIAPVTNPGAQPVWNWILSQPNPEPYPLTPGWNFNKYLISRTGQLIRHFEQNDWPGDDPGNPNDSFATSEIVVAIEAELAQ